MRNIENIRKAAADVGIELSGAVGAPRSDLDTVTAFRKKCESNVCGCYGSCWTCPPGSGPADECLERMHSYDNAVISKIFFDGIDVKDTSQIEKISKKHHEECRILKKIFEAEGFDVLVLADGKCGYCTECTYPSAPCRHPDHQIPSVSGYGIDMEKYLNKYGIEFKFSNDSVTLYSIVLFR